MNGDGNKEVIELITLMKESLKRDIQNLDQKLSKKLDVRFDEVNARFDTQAARLERHAALLQTGSRWTNRMNQWSEKIDRAFEARDQQMRNLIKRVEDLEGKSPKQPPSLG